MITVTRMNGSSVVVNAELIEFLEATPDTIMTLTTGQKLLLKDTVEEVVKKALTYRRSIGTKFIVVGSDIDKDLLSEALQDGGQE